MDLYLGGSICLFDWERIRTRNLVGCSRNDGCGTLRSRLLDFLVPHKVSARARRCETPWNSFEISLPISFAFCLKRKSARNARRVCPFGKFSHRDGREHFTVGNCYRENERSPMHFPRIQKRARYPVLRSRESGVNRISQRARRYFTITKIDRDRCQFELHRSLFTFRQRC